MAMVYCRGCARQLHETAPTCTQCGAPQFAVPTGSSWKAVTSLILGILCALKLFERPEHSNDSTIGLSLTCAIGLTLGVLNLSQKRPGSGMAIAGIVMAVLSLLYVQGL